MSDQPAPEAPMSPEQKKFMAIQNEAMELQKMYQTDPRQNSFNLLLLGESGSGKTVLSSTARKPIHIDSFDPGGAKHLMPLVNKGEVIVDARWEAEDTEKGVINKPAGGPPGKDFAYPIWKKEFERRLAMGYFENLGTYVLDSSTTWSMAIMNWILSKAGIAGEAPRFTKDYGPQKIEIQKMIKKCLDLPCDFILTGHLEAEKDELIGKVKYKYMVTGKAEIIIPLLFDEIWVCMSEQKGMKDVEYKVLTKKNGFYPGATRIGLDKFDTFEDPNIKALLKKAGRDNSDKPLLTKGGVASSPR